MVGWPLYVGFIKTETGSFDLGYFAMALFMLIAGITTLTIKYGWTGQKKRQPVTENTNYRYCRKLNNSNKKLLSFMDNTFFYDKN